MKTFVRIGALTATVALVACSSHKAVTTSNGATTVTQDASGQSTTVQTDQGTVTVGKSADPAQLGAPIYPGADANSAGTVSYTGASGGAMSAFKTTDDFGKVYDYYKSQLPAGSEKMKMQSSDGSIAQFVVTNAAGETAVQISGKPGETEIIITHKARP
jgi:ABC-type enterochelin transport system substrate-binding protein